MFLCCQFSKSTFDSCDCKLSCKNDVVEELCHGYFLLSANFLALCCVNIRRLTMQWLHWYFICAGLHHPGCIVVGQEQSLSSVPLFHVVMCAETDGSLELRDWKFLKWRLLFYDSSFSLMIAVVSEWIMNAGSFLIVNVYASYMSINILCRHFCIVRRSFSCSDEIFNASVYLDAVELRSLIAWMMVVYVRLCRFMFIVITVIPFWYKKGVW